MQLNKHTKIEHRVNQAIHTKGSVCLRLRTCWAVDAWSVTKYLQNISLVIVLLLALRNIHLILLHFENCCGDLIVGVVRLIIMHPEIRNNLLGFWGLSFLKHCQSCFILSNVQVEHRSLKFADFYLLRLVISGHLSMVQPGWL